MPQILSVDVVHEGWSTFRLVRFRLDNGAEVDRAVEDHGDAVAVLPYDAERRVALLVRQFRAPQVFKGSPGGFEPPAGLIDEGERPEDAARREMLEETGVRVGALEPLGRYWSSPGSSMEETTLFLAAYSRSDRIAEGGGTDEHEDIALHEAPLADLARAADRGELMDLKLLALVQTLRLKRPELFR